MHFQKRLVAAVNVLGGVAVLGSYTHDLSPHPDTGSQLWGGVPESIRPLYGAWMSMAAAGYLVFTYYLFFRVDPQAACIANRLDFKTFNLLYLAILAPSAVWMPLTFELLEGWNAGLWLLIQLVSWAVGLASVTLVVVLLNLRSRQPARLYWLAVVGSVAFTVQTGLLDALVWVTLNRDTRAKFRFDSNRGGTSCRNQQRRFCPGPDFLMALPSKNWKW